MIGGNIGMSYISNETGISSLAGSAGYGGITAEFTGESPFQKMMSQVMANGSSLQMGTGTKTEAGTVPNSGNLSEANSIGQLLAGLMLGSTGQAKLNLQNAVDAAVEIEESGAAENSDADLSELMSSSLDSILSMFEGPVNAYLVSNQGGMNSEKSLLDANALKTLIGATNGADNTEGGMKNRINGSGQPENYQSMTSSAAQVISEITDNNGKMSVLAEIKGKTVEISGHLKGSETPASATFESSAEGVSTSESTGTMTAMEIKAILNGNTAESSSLVNLAAEKSGSGDSMKTAALQQMRTPEAFGMQQSGFAEKSLQDVTGTSKDKPETTADSIEGSLKSAAYQSQFQSTARTDAADASQLTQPTEAPEAYSQIREEILSKLEQKGPTEFKMQLQPEDLGQIDISLKLSEGKLVIDILAANSKTQALLTGQVDKLITSMGLQNVQVESVQVSQQMNSQTQDNGQSQGYSMNSAMDFSQRKQQEQYQQELFNHAKLNGAASLQQESTQSDDTVDRIESIRFNSQRLNYAV